MLVISQRSPFQLQKGFDRLSNKLAFWLVAIGCLIGHMAGWAVIPTFPTGEVPTSVVTADFNKDGFDDIAVTTSGVGDIGKLYIFFSNKQGGFNQSQVFNLSTSSPLIATVVLSSNNTLANLSVMDERNKVTYNFLNNGSGTFSQVSTLPSDPSSIASGNFRGNGKTDLVFANPKLSVLSIFYGNGDGTFTPGPQIATSPQPTYVATGDVNNDGLDDIVVSYALGDQIKVFLNNGSGNFTEAGTYPVGTFPNAIAVGDLSNNGFQDIAVANVMSNEVSVLLNRGAASPGTFQNPVNYAVSNAPVSLTLGDFNGTGGLDIATANEASSTVSLLLNNGDGTFQRAPDQKVGSAPISITSGRYTSSPLASFLTVNAAGGSVSVMAQRASTSTTLVQSSVSSTVGEPVTFTATVTPGASPNTLTGTVTFLDGQTVLGTVPITITGNVAKAALTTSSLTAGTHVITAVYSGDVNFNSSTSNSVTHIVNGVITTTTLAVSPNPAFFGQPVTLAAAVSQPTATGTVTFFDGTSPIGTVPLINGTATLTINSFAIGTHVLTAVYSGDASFTGSSSAPVTLIVGSAILPPTHLRGVQKANRFATQTDLINVLTWKAPKTGNAPVEYRIYRNSELTKLVKIVPAHSKNKFKDHNRRRRVLYHYFIVSVDASGQVSEPAIVAVPPRK